MRCVWGPACGVPELQRTAWRPLGGLVVSFLRPSFTALLAMEQCILLSSDDEHPFADAAAPPPAARRKRPRDDASSSAACTEPVNGSSSSAAAAAAKGETSSAAIALDDSDDEQILVDAQVTRSSNRLAALASVAADAKTSSAPSTKDVKNEGAVGVHDAAEDVKHDAAGQDGVVRAAASVRHTQAGSSSSTGSGAGGSSDTSPGNDDDDACDITDLDVTDADDRSGGGLGGGGYGSSYISIDLCDDDEDEAGGTFAKQLNLLFDNDEDVQFVGENLRGGDAPPAGNGKAKAAAPSPRGRSGKRRATGVGSTSSGVGTGGCGDAIELDDDDDDGVVGFAGFGGGGGSPARLGKAKREGKDEEEDEDARMARRIQAQLDADAAEERARQAKGNSEDEQIALRLQARLAREIAEAEDVDGPQDILATQRNKIRNWLAQNAAALNVRDVQPVPSAQPGGKLYQRFADAWNSSRDKGVRLVFHGTREENIASICEHGLDPSRRGKNGQALGAGEYFAENVQISIPYCGGGKRMLVFAVLMDQSGLTKRQSGIVVINKVRRARAAKGRRARACRSEGRCGRRHGGEELFMPPRLALMLKLHAVSVPPTALTFRIRLTVLDSAVLVHRDRSRSTSSQCTCSPSTLRRQRAAWAERLLACRFLAG